MRSRTLIAAGIVVLVAVISIVALNALTAPTKDVIDEVQLATVVVSKERIEANQRLDPLIRAGVFKEIEIPLKLVVEGAIGHLDELEGTTTTTVIVKNEQMSSIRLTSGCCIDRIDTPAP